MRKSTVTKRGRIGELILLIGAVGIGGCVEPVRLQFRPQIGQKQTMRVTFYLATTHPAPAGQDVTEHTWTFTARLEPLAIAPDGSVTMKVAILRVCEESSLRNRGKIRHFDSDEGGLESSQYAAFLGESFTIVTSAQGTVSKLDTDAFYAAIAENRIKTEDKAMQVRVDAGSRWGYGDDDDTEMRRRFVQAETEKAIQAENAKYGSREKRKQAYKEQAYKEQTPDFLFNNTNLLRTLLTHLLPPLAARPVKRGDQWPGPVMLFLEGLMVLKGTYSFQGLEGGVCTLQAEARRGWDDQPIESPQPPVRKPPRANLAGTYRATIKVDQATGSLLSQQAVMELKGTAPMPSARTFTFGDPVPITTKATVTVEPMQ
jgi:hypothetical protein